MAVPDRAVRARTRAGRLAALDRWLVEREAGLLGDGRQGALVDVGFGESPVTTRELAAAVWAVNPELRIIGVDRSAVLPGAEPRLTFVRGGFEVLAGLGAARVVRAVNVLRAYREDEVPEVHAALGASLIDGGLVVEGSTDTGGGVTVGHLLRKTGVALRREALLFHTDFSRGFSPWLFRDWLPRDLRRRVHDGEPMHAFLSAWGTAFDASPEREPAQAFIDSTRRLAGTVEGVSTDEWCLSHGYLRWAPRAGVPGGAERLTR